LGLRGFHFRKLSTNAGLSSGHGNNMVVKDFKIIRIKSSNIMVRVNKPIYLGSEINSGWKIR
jgi:hypothetical protein